MFTYGLKMAVQHSLIWEQHAAYSPLVLNPLISSHPPYFSCSTENVSEPRHKNNQRVNQGNLQGPLCHLCCVCVGPAQTPALQAFVSVFLCWLCSSRRFSRTRPQHTVTSYVLSQHGHHYSCRGVGLIQPTRLSGKRLYSLM